ncbi:MAG: hypothetical protein IPK20_00550 [Betaproteobacteria bacterium]|nr:hypothetical protein [Betaproteobacteria bacterium]
MNTTRSRIPALLLLVSLLALAGCGSRDIAGLDVARARIEPLVFDDAYGDDLLPGLLRHLSQCGQPGLAAGAHRHEV